MTPEKTKKAETTEAEEAEEGAIINPIQDTRRWVQIGDGPGTWHLIAPESAGVTIPVKTACGQETTSQLFLDRLPGGSDSDPSYVAEDCYEFVGISAPKKGRKADEDEEEATETDPERATRLTAESRKANEKATTKSK